MKKYIVLLGILLIFGLYSCDEIQAPYTEDGQIDVDTTTRKVLLEEFTGFRCGNCPEAGEVAHEVVDNSNGRVILMSIHAGDLADPTPARKYNFKTQEGNNIADYFALPATPFGLVNRVSYNGAYLLGPTAWATAAAVEANKPAYVKLELSANYNASIKEISLDVKMKFLQQVSENLNVVAYIVEDSIIQYQRDDRQKDVNVLDYNHMHVLRGSMNGTWGELISDTTIPPQSEIDKNIKFTIPDTKDWKPKDVSLIVTIINTENKEVQQVEKIKLIK